MTVTEPEVLIERDGALGRIVLNRPKAINALTHTMVTAIHGALREWASDPQIAAVAVTGAGERGLCAGGDIRSIYDDSKAGGHATDDFWADEYRLNRYISEYPKPYIAVMDGLVMGGGVGVSAHGSHRIATERSRIAMPEVGIGFIPDVGGTHILAHAPGAGGLHAALTAMQMGAADAIANGFADAYVPTSRIEELLAAVAGGESADDALARFSEEPEPGRLEEVDRELGECYSGRTVAEMVQRMEALGSPLATETAEKIRASSPVSVEVALESIRRAQGLGTLPEVLKQEYRVSLRSLREGDFIEGIRAQIIDKDRNPQWQPATLEEVDRNVVESYFAPLGEEELSFTE